MTLLYAIIINYLEFIFLILTQNLTLILFTTIILMFSAVN